MLALAVALLAACLSVGVARAGGMDYAGLGTRPLGRAGAYAARADDAMALGYNPALLGRVGERQVLLNSHFAFYRACMQRSGTYTDNVTIHDRSVFGDSELGSGQGGYALEPYPQVCNEGSPIPGPTLVYSMALSNRFGLGAGLLLPATAGMVQWGDPNGTVVGVTGESRPNPLRYMTIASGGFALSPSVGASWQALNWLRLGATLQWGIASMDVLSYGVTTGGENPSLDGRAEMTGTDYFIPAFVVGAHVTPVGGLEIGASARWSDDLRGSADAKMRFGDFGSGEPGSTVPTDDVLTGMEMIMPMPWQVSAGVRYVSRHPPGPEERRQGNGQGDPLDSERWDIEIDLVYEANSRVDEVLVTPAAGATVTTRQVLASGELMTLEVPVETPFRVPRGWKDQLALRVGGDYTILRGRWAMRAGMSFETRGLDEGLANIDLLPARRLGLHVGTTVRLGHGFEISAAYAHLFQETLEVADTGEPGGAALPQMAADGTGRVINAGTFAGHWNVFSIGTTLHF